MSKTVLLRRYGLWEAVESIFLLRFPPELQRFGAPLHGGANQAVIEMLTEIQKDGGNYHRAIQKSQRQKKTPFRLMGFGHRVYKAYDPPCQKS